MSSYETFEDQQQSPIEFERVSEQYVKGNDVVAYFTVLKQIDVNEENDRVGLMRIGTTNVKDCLLFGEVHFDETSETDSVRRGTATFPSSVLPVSNEEMYKFCYLSNLTKLLGTSSPFQLNFEPDDIELLSNDPFGRDKMESLVAIANSDDDMVVVQPKRVYIEEKLRQENRQLSDMNNRLENEKIEYQTQLKILMFKQKEAEKKFKGDIQALTDAQQQANDDLRVCQETEAELRAEYDVCRAQCDRYKKEIDEQSKCCREFEEKNAKILVETDQIRRQAVTSEQALRDQQTQLADLERRLLQANETNKSLTQRHNILEERIRELSATSDKQQLNMRTQIDEYNRQIEQRENQIRALQETNHLCQEELNTIKNENDNLVEMSQQDKILVKQLQDELEQCRTNLQEENDNIKQQLNNLRAELNERKSGETALTQSMKELEKRCVKHQKQEVEAKRQLTHYQETIKDFEEQIRELKQRVIDGGKKYENLYRNYKHLEESVKNNSIEEQKEVPRAQTPEPELVPPEINREEQEEEDELNAVLTNTAPLNNNNQNQRSFSLADRQTLASVDGAVKNCPVCDWEFPQNLSVDGKRLHIEEHFNDH